MARKHRKRRGVSRGRASPHPAEPKARKQSRRNIRNAQVVQHRERAWEPITAGVGKITGTGERPNHELLGKLHRLRLKCRTLITSTPQGNAYIRYSVDNILTRRGFSPDYGEGESANLRDEVNAAWADWTEGACSVDGRTHFADLCRTFVRSYLVDGESFVRFYPEAGGLRLEVIDPFRVPTMGNSSQSVMGVVLNREGRPEKYQIRELDMWADPSFSQINEVPVEFVAHCANLQFPHQLRGTPPITVVMQAIKSYDEFRQYALEAAQVNASYIGTLNEQPDATQDFAADFTDTRDSDDDDDDGNGDRNDTVKVLEYGGLQMFQSPDGYNLTPFAGKFPDQVTGMFLSSMARQIATGLGLAAHNLDGDFSGINYSAGRMAEMSQRLHFDQLRDMFIRTTLGPIYSSWLRWMGFPAKRPVWAQADRAQIDPSKEAMTLHTLVAAGIISRAEAMRQLGHDAEEMQAQIEAEGWKNPNDNTNTESAPENPEEENPGPVEPEGGDE